jgi:hypothetical protein
MPRVPRDHRRTGTKVVLTQRDQALLCAVGRFRLVTTADVAVLFFPGRHRDVCADRLRRLFDAGFLEVRAAERAAQNQYNLGPAGRKWIADQGGTWRSPPRGGVEHHLGIVQVWATLASVLHDRPGLSLTRFIPDWEIRSGNACLATVVPDALVEVGRPDEAVRGPVRLALEVDLGTEWLPMLRRKLRAYRELAGTDEGAFGWKSFGLALAVLGPGAPRTSALRQLVAREWDGEWALWTTKQDVATWVETLIGSRKAPVTDSRFGNGREGDASRLESTDQDVAGGTLSENVTGACAAHDGRTSG